MRRFWFFRAIKFVIFASLFLLIGGFITMTLWNSLIPLLFHGPVLNFWQTIGLLILCKILFGGFGRGGWKGRNRESYKDRCRGWKEKMQEKMNGMSEEERSRWKEKMSEKMKGMSEDEKEKFKKKFNVTINL